MWRTGQLPNKTVAHPAVGQPTGYDKWTQSPRLVIFASELTIEQDSISPKWFCDRTSLSTTAF